MRVRGKLGQHAIADTIAGANVDRVQAVEHVELGQRQRVDAVDADRVADRHGVVPAAAARPPGRRAVLLTALPQSVADLAVQFRRQRTLADAGGVGLGDAEHAVNRLRRNAQAGARAADRGIRRCHVRIGPVIDVEHRALRALDQDAPAGAGRLVERDRHVAGPAAHPVAKGEQLIVDRLPVERGVLDHPVAGADVLAHVVGQGLRVDEVADADAPAADLVFVRGTDASRRRADLALAAPRLAQHVELAVVRQDEMRLLADQQPIADVDAEPRQLFDLLEQRLRIDDDAVADHAQDTVVQDAGRDQVEDELLSVDVDRVAGVVPTLIARHDRKRRRHQIDDLAFAFVAPLRAQHHDIHRLLLYPTTQMTQTSQGRR